MGTIRSDNLVWTVAEDYSFVPSRTILEFDSPINRDFLNNCLLGYCYNRLNMDIILEFFKLVSSNYSNKKDLLTIARLLLEDNLYENLLCKRPALKEKRQIFIKSIVDYYNKRKPKDISQEVEYQYYRSFLNLPLTSNEIIINIIEDIKYEPKTFNTSEIIMLLEKIYSKYFHVNENMEFTSKVENLVEEAKELEKKNVENRSLPLKKYRGINIAELEKYQIGSAEFTEVEILENINVEERPSPELSLDSKDNSDILESVEAHFGINAKGDLETLSWEREICTGIHEKIKLHFTKGEYKTDIKSYYFKDLLTSNSKENLDYYNKNILAHKRSIVQLKEIIKNSILSDLDYSTTRASSGKILPDKIYRNKYLNDNLIFKREFKEEYGSISVDILLDSSASQEDHANMVVTQAYIITSALTQLNIPTRVLGFNNLFNYLVVKEFRDYNDNSNYNKNIFNYYPTGSNRDGLAIKYVRQSLKNNNIDKKIIIILSDGKPNDKISLNLPGIEVKLAQDYENEVALKDTAMEVMKCKLDNLAVLGVFTGNEEDLEKEKLIYSKDFSYITNINRFSSIVGTFLKQLVEKY